MLMAGVIGTTMTALMIIAGRKYSKNVTYVMWECSSSNAMESGARHMKSMLFIASHAPKCHVTYVEIIFKTMNTTSTSTSLV